MSPRLPAVVGNPTPAPVFDWRVATLDEQRATLGRLFDALVEDHPEFALGVHFDEVSGYLSMPEPPTKGAVNGDERNTYEEWHQTRLRLREVASGEAGHEVQSFIKDDRYYRFRFHEFTEDNWRQLFGAYTRLPGWLPGNPETDVARWFGANESWPPFMWASVESFGLEVFGVLLESDWARWERAFLAETAGLPAMAGSVAIAVEEEDVR